LQTSKGIALQDILVDLHTLIIKIKELDGSNKSFLLDQLANIEYRLSMGTNEDIQLSALVGACQIARNSLK
jgi:replication factor C subunit 3/5